MVARDDEGRSQNDHRQYGQLAGMGLQFGAAIVLFALAGHWLDGKISTTPLFLVLGVLLGFAGGTISLVRQVGRMGDKRKSD